LSQNKVEDITIHTHTKKNLFYKKLSDGRFERTNKKVGETSALTVNSEGKERSTLCARGNITSPNISEVPLTISSTYGRNTGSVCRSDFQVTVVLSVVGYVSYIKARLHNSQN
jgi:hypothetical protein